MCPAVPSDQSVWLVKRNDAQKANKNNTQNKNNPPKKQQKRNDAWNE